MFNSLTKEDIYKIIDIELKGLYSRIQALGYNIELTTAAKDFIAEKGFDPEFGARPLKRAIQKYLEDEMAEVIIKSPMKQGDVLLVDYDKEKDEITINLKKKRKAALPKGEKEKLKEKESE